MIANGRIVNNLTFNDENLVRTDKKVIKKILRQVPEFLWIIKLFLAAPQKVIKNQIESPRRRLRENSRRIEDRHSFSLCSIVLVIFPGRISKNSPFPHFPKGFPL